MLLYFRMILTMLVTLYTSRVVLNTLGVEDFGIYNVVGGVVVMFSFLNSAMSSATQRFLSFELGKNNIKQFTKVFSMSINIHALIALIILFLAETIGLWFVNTQLVIPADRLDAANWVYQCSILAFMVTIMSVPYNASIIAHEKMGAFAYISILEVSLKLLIVFMLQWLAFDKLKLYAVLFLSVAVIIRLVYGFYCKLRITGCRYVWTADKKLFQTLFSFAGWNLWGNMAAAAMDQGTNILINMFYGPIINAARGIAYQAGSAIRLFVSNFQVAVNPQLVKRYASNNLSSMHELVFQSSKYSYLLLLLLGFPAYIESDYLIYIWLGQIPSYSSVFLKLVIIIQLIDCLSGPLMTAAQASGRIKLYQFVIGSIFICSLPLSYVFLKLGFSVVSVFYVNILISILTLIFRLLIITPLIKMNISEYIKSVLLKIVLVTFIAPLIPLYIHHVMEYGFMRLFLISFSYLISFTISVYVFGLGAIERQFVKLKLKVFFNRL